MMKTILLVDDDPDQVFSIKAAFTQLYADEYEIVGADGGKQCFEVLKKIQPDLIILDLMMPDMTGWEVFDRLKASDAWKEIPVIILTARTDGFAEQAGQMIAEDYVKKPIEIEELKSRIDLVLSKN